MRIFTYVIIVIVAAAITAGFFIVGSPSEERLRRFDEKRIQDLQFIQGEIINYWQSKGQLPDNLGKLNDSIRGIAVPEDPELAKDYAYFVKAELTFELCATFNLENRGHASNSLAVIRPPKIPYPAESVAQANNWDHEAGYFCFERTIDKDLYKKLPSTD